MFQVVTNTGPTGTILVGGAIAYTNNNTSTGRTLDLTAISNNSPYTDSQLSIYYPNVNNYVYVLNDGGSGPGTVTVVNGNTNTIVTTVTIGNQSSVGPFFMAANPNTNLIYCVNGADNTVTVINGNTLSTSTISVGSGPIGITCNPNTNTIYVANNASSSISVINGATNTVSSTVSIGYALIGIKVDPISNILYGITSTQFIAYNCYTNTVTNVILVPGSSNLFGIDLDPYTNKLYLCDVVSNSVYVYNTVSLSLLATVTSTINAPRTLAVNPYTDSLYIPNSGTTNVSVISTVSYEAEIPIPTNGSYEPLDVAINTVTNTIYIGTSVSNSVQVINGNTNTVTATILGFSSPRSIVTCYGNAYFQVQDVTGNEVLQVYANGSRQVEVNGTLRLQSTGGTGHAYDNISLDLTQNGPGAPYYDQTFNSHYPNVTQTYGVIYANDSTDAGNPIFSFNPVSGTGIMSTYAVGNGSNQIAINSNTNNLYAISSTGLYVVNANTNVLTAIVPLGISGAFSIMINPTTNVIYVGNTGSAGSVAVVDGATNTLINGSPITVQNSPRYGDVNYNTNTVYLANFSSNSLSVINGSTNTVTTNITGFNGPFGVAVNSNTNMIYVTNSATGTTSVVNGLSNTIVATITVGTLPEYIALNPVTNYIYVSNVTSATVSCINGYSNTVTSSVPVSGVPGSIVANSITNYIFTTVNSPTGNVAFINGQYNTASTLLSTPLTAKFLTINYYTTSKSIYDINGNQIFKASVDGSQQTTINASLNVSPPQSIYTSVQKTIDMSSVSTGSAYFDSQAGVHYPNVATVNSSTGFGTVPPGGYVQQANYVYCSNSNGSSNAVTVYSTLTNTLVATLSMTRPGIGVANPFTNLVYVLGVSSAIVYVINSLSNTLIGNFSIPAVGYGIGINYFTNTLYIMGGGTSNLYVINAYTNTLIKTISLPHSCYQFVTVNPVTNTVYMICSTSGTYYVVVVNGTYNSVVASITLPANAVNLAINTNTNTLFVASNNIDVINCFTNTIIATIAPSTQPICMAVNSATNILYAFTSSGLSVINCSNNYQIVTTVSLSTVSIGQIEVNTALNTVYYQSGTSFIVLNGYTNTVAATIPNSNLGEYYIYSNSLDPTFNVYNSNNTTSFQVHGINGNFNGGGINSAAGNAFYPTSTNSMSSGTPYNLWTTTYTQNVNSGSSTLTLTSSATSGSGIVIQDGSGGGTFINSDYCVVQDVTNGGNTLAVRTSSGTGIFTVSAVAAQVNIGSVGTNVPINYNLNHCVDAIGVYEFVSTVSNPAANSNVTGYLSYPSGKSQTNVRIIEAIMSDGTNCISPNYVNNTGFSYSAVANNNGIACFTNTTWTQTTGSKTFYIWVWMT